MEVTLSETHRVLYLQYCRAALKGGCDTAQAQNIASERLLAHIMRGDAQVIEVRNRIADNPGRDGPRGKGPETRKEQTAA